MTLGKIEELYNQTKQKDTVNASEMIEWAKVLKGDEVVKVDGFYPSEAYNYEVLFGLVTKEFTKLNNIPKKYPIGGGKKNFLMSKKEKNSLVLLNSGSKEFQILVKFTDAFTARLNAREKAERDAFGKQIRALKAHLSNITGKILVETNFSEMSPNDYESSMTRVIVTLKNGVVINSETLYEREFSKSSDIYIVVKHGGPFVSDFENGDINAPVPATIGYINYTNNTHGGENRFRTDLGYWKVVKDWYEGLK